MSGWLIIVTGLIYLWVAIEQSFEGVAWDVNGTFHQLRNHFEFYILTMDTQLLLPQSKFRGAVAYESRVCH